MKLHFTLFGLIIIGYATKNEAINDLFIINDISKDTTIYINENLSNDEHVHGLLLTYKGLSNDSLKVSISLNDTSKYHFDYYIYPNEYIQEFRTDWYQNELKITIGPSAIESKGKLELKYQLLKF